MSQDSKHVHWESYTETTPWGKLGYSTCQSTEPNNRWLVCFHGAGQGPLTAYRPWPALYADKYNICVVHLFGYGESRVNKAIDPKSWQQSFNILMDKLGIKSYDLVAFSLGAIPALSLLSSGFIHLPNHLHLIAPAALSHHHVYKLATHFGLGRWLFKIVSRKPYLLGQLVRILTTVKLLPASLSRLTLYQTKPNRMQALYIAWTNCYRLQVAEQELVKNVANLKITVWLARHDHLIDNNYWQKLSRRQGWKVQLLHVSHFEILNKMSVQ